MGWDAHFTENFSRGFLSKIELFSGIFVFICADPKTRFSEKTRPIIKYKICLHGLVPTPILNLALPDFFEKSCVSRPFVYLLDHFRHLQRPKQYQFYVLHPKNEVCQLETFPGNVIKKVRISGNFSLSLFCKNILWQFCRTNWTIGGHTFILSDETLKKSSKFIHKKKMFSKPMPTVNCYYLYFF